MRFITWKVISFSSSTSLWLKLCKGIKPVTQARLHILQNSWRKDQEDILRNYKECSSRISPNNTYYPHILCQKETCQEDKITLHNSGQQSVWCSTLPGAGMTTLDPWHVLKYFCVSRFMKYFWVSSSWNIFESRAPEIFLSLKLLKYFWIFSSWNIFYYYNHCLVAGMTRVKSKQCV